MNLLPDKTVMRASADMAPANTVILECRMAIIAAMKNVLSPNSETTITERDAMKACVNPTLNQTPLLGSFFGVVEPIPSCRSLGGPSSSSNGNEWTTVTAVTISNNKRGNLALVDMALFGTFQNTASTRNFTTNVTACVLDCDPVV